MTAWLPILPLHGLTALSTAGVVIAGTIALAAEAGRRRLQRQLEGQPKLHEVERTPKQWNPGEPEPTQYAAVRLAPDDDLSAGRPHGRGHGGGTTHHDPFDDRLATDSEVERSRIEGASVGHGKEPQREAWCRERAATRANNGSI